MTTSETAQPELSDEARSAVKAAVTSIDGVGLNRQDPETVIQVVESEEKLRSVASFDDPEHVTEFEVLVNAVGRLVLDGVLESQGQLLYCKGEDPYVEISLKGFENGMLLLEVVQCYAEE